MLLKLLLIDEPAVVDLVVGVSVGIFDHSPRTLHLTLVQNMPDYEIQREVLLKSIVCCDIVHSDLDMFLFLTDYRSF